jgi:hypothetical protein
VGLFFKKNRIIRVALLELVNDNCMVPEVTANEIFESAVEALKGLYADEVGFNGSMQRLREDYIVRVACQIHRRTQRYINEMEKGI